MMSEFDKIVSDTQEKIEFHTEQYNTPTYEDEVHTHTSGGTYFGDVEETNAIVSVDKSDTDNTPTVTTFDYFVFFGLILIAIFFILGKFRKERSK